MSKVVYQIQKKPYLIPLEHIAWQGIFQQCWQSKMLARILCLFTTMSVKDKMMCQRKGCKQLRVQWINSNPRTTRRMYTDVAATTPRIPAEIMCLSPTKFSTHLSTFRTAKRWRWSLKLGRVGRFGCLSALRRKQILDTVGICRHYLCCCVALRAIQ